MNKLAAIGIFSLILSAGTVSADQNPGPSPTPSPSPTHSPGDGDCHGQNCLPPTRKVCFNVLCLYEDKDDHGSPGPGPSPGPSHTPGDGHDNDKSCRGAATFFGLVTVDGGEVQRDSDFDDKVQLEVKCGDRPGFNGGARRLTDLLGTRIQGDTGPFPAITLPRGALHTGPNGSSGDHSSLSTLEFDNGEIEKLHGKCYIWTGAP